MTVIPSEDLSFSLCRRCEPVLSFHCQHSFQNYKDKKIKERFLIHKKTGDPRKAVPGSGFRVYGLCAEPTGRGTANNEKYEDEDEYRKRKNRSSASIHHKESPFQRSVYPNIDSDDTSARAFCQGVCFQSFAINFHALDKKSTACLKFDGL